MRLWDPSYGMIQAIIAQIMNDSCLKAVETGLRLWSSTGLVSAHV
jgi:hypothetical protein